MPIIEFNVTLPSESLVEDIDQQFVQKREEDVLWKQEFEFDTKGGSQKIKMDIFNGICH